MHPFSPKDYFQMIEDIERDRFAVHMDIVNMINTPEKYLFNKEFTDKAFEMLGKYIKSCHIKDVVMQTSTVNMQFAPWKKAFTYTVRYNRRKRLQKLADYAMRSKKADAYMLMAKTIAIRTARWL